jgi:hypothetical protein
MWVYKSKVFPCFIFLLLAMEMLCYGITPTVLPPVAAIHRHSFLQGDPSVAYARSE